MQTLQKKGHKHLPITQKLVNIVCLVGLLTMGVNLLAQALILHNQSQWKLIHLADAMHLVVSPELQEAANAGDDANISLLINRMVKHENIVYASLTLNENGELTTFEGVGIACLAALLRRARAVTARMLERTVDVGGVPPTGGRKWASSRPDRNSPNRVDTHHS